jgi:hypothetical protein
MFRHFRGVSLSTILLVVTVGRAGAQECIRFQGAPPEELTSYLDKTARSPANEACAAFAINELGSERYEPAITALTKWLELRWPPGAHQKQRRFVIERDGGKTIYPAAAALELMGKDALPTLLDAIKTRPASREWMDVAVSVWMTYYKDQAPAGVALLKQEADNTRDPAIRGRLGWAAFRALGWCDPSEREKCSEALGTWRPN